MNSTLSNNQLMQPPQNTPMNNSLPPLPPINEVVNPTPVPLPTVTNVVENLEPTIARVELNDKVNDKPLEVEKKKVNSKNANTIIIVLGVIFVIVLIILSFLLGRLSAPVITKTIDNTDNQDEEVVSVFDSSLWLARAQNGSGSYEVTDNALTMSLKTSLLESGTAFARYDLKEELPTNFDVSVTMSDYVLDSAVSSSLNRLVFGFDANDTNFFNIRLVTDASGSYLDSRYVSDSVNETSEKVVITGTPEITFSAKKTSNSVTLSYSLDGATAIVIRDIENFIDLSLTPSLQLYANVNNTIAEEIEAKYSAWSVE